MFDFSKLIKDLKPYVLSWVDGFTWVNSSSSNYAFKVLDGRTLAIRVTVNTSVLQGQVLKMSTTSGLVTLTAANEDMPIGVAYSDAAAGQQVWLCYLGLARVLFKSGVTGTAGYVVYASDTAGYADNSATAPAVALHNREIGHCLETGTSGGLALCLLHYN